jgi:excisionase family DNA binding protein
MLTIARVAERLQVSRQLVYALVEAGELSAHRFGLKRGTMILPSRAIPPVGPSPLSV